ncbi:MAG: porin family protein [Weeksellaceae bacterium]|jgi:hypothetical protein
MKRKITFLLAIVFCILLTENGYAQVEYGVRVGAIRSNIYDVHVNSKPRYGYQFGAVGLIQLEESGILYLQPEIVFSAQGELGGYREDGSLVEQKQFLNFVNIPIFLKVFFSSAPNGFFAEAGPFIGFKIADNIERYAENLNYEYKSMDIGGALGIGYSFNRQFDLSFRYSRGFMDLVENDNRNSTNVTSIFTLGLVYVLDF